MSLRSEDIVFMLNANLFRALPPSKGGDQENYDPDEEEPSLEPTWPHLQVHTLTPTLTKTLFGFRYLNLTLALALHTGLRMTLNLTDPQQAP